VCKSCLIFAGSNQLKHKTMTTSNQIRQANPQGKMTKVSGTNDIVFDNGVTFKSETSKEMQNLWNKLIRMGFVRHLNLGGDEFTGIKQAGDNGENPFAFSMICADGSKNGIFN
jgi:hypothetical protein